MGRRDSQDSLRDFIEKQEWPKELKRFEKPGKHEKPKKPVKLSEMRDILKYLSLVTQIGLTMVFSVGIGLLGGMFLDRWLNTGIFFMIVLTIIGIASGFRSVYLLIMGLEKDSSGGKESE